MPRERGWIRGEGEWQIESRGSVSRRSPGSLCGKRHLSLHTHPPAPVALSFTVSLFLPFSRDRWRIELSALVDRAYLRRVNPRNFIGNAPHRANPRVPGLAIAP